MSGRQTTQKKSQNNVSGNTKRTQTRKPTQNRVTQTRAAQTRTAQTRTPQNRPQKRKPQQTRNHPVMEMDPEDEARNQKIENMIREISLWLIIGICALLLISILGFGGMVGSYVRAGAFGMFGMMAYLLPFLLFFMNIYLFSSNQMLSSWIKTLTGLLLVLLLCGMIEMTVNGKNLTNIQQCFLNSSVSHTGGGVLGWLYCIVFIPLFGLIGSYIWMFLLIIICLIVLTDKSILRILHKGGSHAYHRAKQETRQRRENWNVEHQKRLEALALEEKTYNDDDEEKETVKKTSRVPRKNRKVSGVDFRNTLLEKEDPQEEASIDYLDDYDPEDLIDSDLEERPMNPKHATVPDFTIDGIDLTEEGKKDEIPGQITLAGKKGRIREEEPEFEEIPVPVVRKKKPKLNAKEAELQEQDIAFQAQAVLPKTETYRFPPINLMGKPEKKRKENTGQELKDTAMKLQQTLGDFGVNVKITNVSCGPAVTRYEMLPEQGVKVSRIVNLSDDIKLNLAATDIRIEAPIPGKSAVGIEVPNSENTMVSLRELLESSEFKKFSSNLTFAVGKDIGGKVVITDIAKMPHLLIAGATGSGKSVCINTIIMSILYKARPDDVKLIMIDPKVVELSVYNGIPHLMIPVVTDPKKAAGALNWAVSEMMNRYDRFAEIGARDLTGYNRKIESLKDIEDPEKPQKMPQIVIIVDELADLMMVAPGDVEDAICRIAQLARAAGIHLIIATQRPSVNVITGIIKANMPSRIAFAVTSGVDSRTILDMNGAEKLLGKGDMLFNPQGVSKPSRIQGAFVSDEEVSKVVDFLKQHNASPYNTSAIEEQMMKLQKNGGSSSSGEDQGGYDAYFEKAGRFLVEKDKASIGMLQRVFKIGFNRAARIMDQLCEAGVVGPEEGTKPRKVLVSMEEFEKIVEEYI